MSSAPSRLHSNRSKKNHRFCLELTGRSFIWVKFSRRRTINNNNYLNKISKLHQSTGSNKPTTSEFSLSATDDAFVQSPNHSSFRVFEAGWLYDSFPFRPFWGGEKREGLDALELRCEDTLPPNHYMCILVLTLCQKARKFKCSLSCVPGCKEYNHRESDKSSSFHSSPLDQQLNKQWIVIILNVTWNNNPLISNLSLPHWLATEKTMDGENLEGH